MGSHEGAPSISVSVSVSGSTSSDSGPHDRSCNVTACVVIFPSADVGGFHGERGVEAHRPL